MPRPDNGTRGSSELTPIHFPGGPSPGGEYDPRRESSHLMASGRTKDILFGLIEALAPYEPEDLIDRDGRRLSVLAIDNGIDPEAAACIPWSPSTRNAGTAEIPDLKVTFHAGTIGGNLPSNWSDEFDYTDDTPHFIYLECAATGGKVTSSAIRVSTTMPTFGITPTAGAYPTSFNELIGVINGSGEFCMVYSAPIAVTVQEWQVAKVSPSAGQEPFDRYYSFTFA